MSSEPKIDTFKALDDGQFPSVYRKVDRAMKYDTGLRRVKLLVGRRRSCWLRNIEFDTILTARDGLATSITQNNLNSAARGLRSNET
jgi:hypothetical protein